jgi:AraC-like DNA-binding protein
MSIFEAGLRGGAVTILLLIAALLLRDARRAPAGRNCALLLLSAAGYVVYSAPGFGGGDVPFGLLLLAVSLGVPALFWIAAAAVFDDAFKPSWLRALAWPGLVALGLWSIFDGQPFARFAYYALSLLLISLGAWHAMVGREADLIETRRRLRLLLAIASAAYAAAIIIADLAVPGRSVSGPFSIINAAALATIAFAFALSWLGIAGEPAALSPAEPSPTPDMHAGQAPAARRDDEQEVALLAALRAAMEEQKLYRHDGLTIAVLAARLGAPEYRLRRLINRRLGHRNFSSFVNGYRLAEARAALADPGQANVPILTIALDTGFQSLAPFNRSFKVTAGMTPSEYRRRRLSGLDPRFSG